MSSLAAQNLISQPTFDNTLLRELPLDSSYNRDSRLVSNACFSLVNPTPIDNPKLVHWSSDALDLIDIDKPDPTLFCGNKLFPNSQPASHCYCGHQFGIFAGQLGDGRAIYLGEIINSKEERWELQLKGAGPTPYSRKSDGRAVLRSSIREFLCSEAMYYLEIPTTRCGTIVTSDTEVIRDIKYDGHPKREKATVVSRIAQSFIRFGSFQITDQGGPSQNNHNIIQQLTDYVIKYHYPNCDNVVKFFREVVYRTAKMVALWQCVGFTHGVMNTDNMSILGLTIDYGPFGFMDAYDPEFISNGSDTDGRYMFKNQPYICKWNLGKLAQSLGNSYPKSKCKIHKCVEEFDEYYTKQYMKQMRKKLGLRSREDDHCLIQQLLDIMEKTHADYTNVFRSLSRIDVNKSPESVLKYILKQCKSNDTTNLWKSWITRYIDRLKIERVDSDRVKVMNHANPRYILRNYMAQDAIEKAEKGDYSEVKKLLEVLQDPYDDTHNINHEIYDSLSPSWSAELCITCSS